MKRILVFLCISALVFTLASPVMAGGIDNKHNFSAEYIRTLNRNATTDSADGVVYNPAGTVKMEDGFYVNLAGQYAYKDYANTLGGVEYDSEEPDAVPGLFALLTKDRWAGYFAFTIPCGGGSVDYEDGNALTIGLSQDIMAGANFLANSAMLAANAQAVALGLPPFFTAFSPYDTIKDQWIEGESFFLGFTLGGAFEINDIFSVSLGARYVDAHREFKGLSTIGASTGSAFPDQTVEIELEETGNGWGGIVGVNIAPTEKLNIGIRYESVTQIDLETDEKTDTLNGSPIAPDGIVVDGAERNRDLPSLIGLGISHQCTPTFRSEVNFTYYMNESTDWEDWPVSMGDETERENGYDVGIAVEHAFTPQLKGSLGYMYTSVGIDPDDMSVNAPELDAHSVAGGFKWEAVPGLDINLGVLKTFYQDETTSAGVKLEKDVIIVALGVQYKFW